MPEARVIKKYPNRRLYDTEESRYIKLADVRTLVLNDVHFVIVDKKSGNDITRNILLQVISEEERQGAPFLSLRFLTEVIRANDPGPAAAAADYLERCLDVYIRCQDGAAGRTASATVAELARAHRGRRYAPEDDARRGSQAVSELRPEGRKKAG